MNKQLQTVNLNCRRPTNFRQTSSTESFLWQYPCARHFQALGKTVYKYVSCRRNKNEAMLKAAYQHFINPVVVKSVEQDHSAQTYNLILLCTLCCSIITFCQQNPNITNFNQLKAIYNNHNNSLFMK